MTPPEGSSLLKSSAQRSFSFMHDNLQAFATHLHSLGNSLLVMTHGLRNTDLDITKFGSGLITAQPGDQV